MKLTGAETEFIFIRLTVLHEYLEKELEMHNLPFKHDIEVGGGFYRIISTSLRFCDDGPNVNSVTRHKSGKITMTLSSSYIMTAC